MHVFEPDILFSKFAQYCTQHPKDKAARSYAAGFLCHFLLDADAHPFVYAKQREIIENEHVKHLQGCVHFRVEHALDCIMLRKIDKANPALFDYSTAVTDDAGVLNSCAKTTSCSFLSVSTRETKSFFVMSRRASASAGMPTTS